MPMVDIDWLKDHVEVPEGLTYEQLAKDLVKVGLEEEEIRTSQLVGPIVVGYVVDATPEPLTNTTKPMRTATRCRAASSAALRTWPQARRSS